MEVRFWKSCQDLEENESVAETDLNEEVDAGRTGAGGSGNSGIPVHVDRSRVEEEGVGFQNLYNEESRDDEALNS